MACVQWSNNRTTRSIWHIQLRENAVRESVQDWTISIKHVPGKSNPSNIFTKADHGVQHYVPLRDCVVSPTPHNHHVTPLSSL